MVASYEIGEPVRSYVRIPGTGTNKAANPSCCDLSRVSQAAAGAPIPRSHIQDTQPVSEQAAPQDVGSSGDGEQSHLTQSHLAAEVRIPDSKDDTVGRDCQATPKLAPKVQGNGQTHDDPSKGNPRKRSHHEDSEDSSATASLFSSKRPRVTSVKSAEGDRSISSVGTSTDGCGSQDESVRDINSVGTNTVEIQTNDSMNALVRERNQLREQNKLLERRLATIRDVFKNKERLQRLIRALDIPS